MTATIYLEAEDEITAAVARIRGLKEHDAVLVLSRSSRIGTSRINFKLLAREAHALSVNLVAVSDEPTVRALAVSAGLPAYDSVSTAEGALEQFRRQDQQLAQRSGRLPAEPGARPSDLRSGAGRDPRAASLDAGSSERDAREHTGVRRADKPGDGSPQGINAAAATAGGAGMASPGTRPFRPDSTRVMPRPELPLEDSSIRPGDERSARGARRRVPVAPLLLLGLLALVVGGGLYVAYLYLPTATVTLRVDARPLAPVELSVTADPSVAVPDAAAGVIPAERIQIPLTVSDEFPATGVNVTRTHSSGIVRFESRNTVFDVTIQSGTRVSTVDGVVFETSEAVTVERADFDSARPTQAEVEVRAVDPGGSGNVARHSITTLPEDLAAAQISVTNPRATSGGRRIEEPAVTQEDYDAAVAQLTALLAIERQARLADPATTPRGLTLHPTTARTEEPSASPSADELVDNEAETFTLSLDATASVLAVNEALVEQVAAEQLRTTIGSGQVVVGNRVEVSHDPGRVAGTTITYAATAGAQVYSEPERDALVADISGKTVDEARAILEQYGSADISIWPEVVDRLPQQAARISLTIVPPREGP